MKAWFVYLPDTSGRLFIAGKLDAQAESNEGRYPGALQKAQAAYGATAFVVPAGPSWQPRIGNLPYE